MFPGMLTCFRRLVVLGESRSMGWGCVGSMSMELRRWFVGWVYLEWICEGCEDLVLMSNYLCNRISRHY